MPRLSSRHFTLPLLVFFALVGLAVPGCATAGGDGGDDPLPDAAPRPDAPSSPVVDAMPGVPDAMPMVPDAMPLPDAPPQCTDQDVQILSNPNFDLGPGNGWVEVAADPIVFDSGALPVTPQTGSYAAWLGGVPSATRTIYQDVAIPAGATNVRITFFRYIASEEGGGVYDTLNISLRNASNIVLEPVVNWDNTYQNNAWQMYNHTVSGNFSGQTVRLYMSSTNDDTLDTNFFIDTLTVMATVCL